MKETSPSATSGPPSAIDSLPTRRLQQLLLGASDLTFAMRAAIEDELHRRSREELDGTALTESPYD
jgi:hypothetical protein